MLFKQTILTLAALCLLASCKSEKSEDNNIATPTATTQPQPGFEATKHTNKALVLINNLWMFDKGRSPKNKIPGLYGLVVDVDSISAKRYALTQTDDNCLEHNFVYLNSPKIKGWAYGQDVFEYAHDGRDTVFTLQDIEFKLYATKNFSIGASDDDGLTGCGGDSPAVLYNSRYKTEAFIPMSADTLYNSKYLVLDEHDGWVDKVTGATLQDNKLLLTLHREYQEGSADFTIEIKVLQNGYHGKVVQAVRHEPEY